MAMTSHVARTPLRLRTWVRDAADLPNRDFSYVCQLAVTQGKAPLTTLTQAVARA